MANELVVRDLKIIYKLDKSLDYDNLSNVKAYYNKLIDLDSFNTSVGKAYIDKLQKIISGSNTGECIICHKTEVGTKAIGFVKLSV